MNLARFCFLDPTAREFYPDWAAIADATVALLRELLPETADLPVTRHVLPNLRAVNFVVDGILGQGVAYQARFDPQAKGLGEWLRSRHLEIPEEQWRSFIAGIKAGRFDN